MILWYKIVQFNFSLIFPPAHDLLNGPILGYVTFCMSCLLIRSLCIYTKVVNNFVYRVDFVCEKSVCLTLDSNNNCITTSQE